MDTQDVTALLGQARDGDHDAVGKVYALLQSELAQIARARLRSGGQNSFDTVELVNESYLRLCDQKNIQADSRVHFLALSSRAMRHVLIDYFRKHTAAKRGGDTPVVTLHDDLHGTVEKSSTLLALDDALNTLAGQDARLAQVVECRFFGGMSYDEIGLALGLAARTVRADWRKAKAWLSLELRSQDATD